MPHGVSRFRSDRTNHRCERPLHWYGQWTETSMKTCAPDMPIVPAEEFVSRVPGKCDRDGTPRQRRNQMGGDLRGISEGLVVHLRQIWNHVACIGRRDDQLGVIGAKMMGDAACVNRFVK